MLCFYRILLILYFVFYLNGVYQGLPQDAVELIIVMSCCMYAARCLGNKKQEPNIVDKGPLSTIFAKTKQ